MICIINQSYKYRDNIRKVNYLGHDNIVAKFWYYDKTSVIHWPKKEKTQNKQTTS